MESRFRFIVVGCLQRLASAAACVRCHSLMSLDDGGARGAAADFLLFYSSRRVLHDSTRFLMPEDAYKNRAGHQSVILVLGCVGPLRAPRAASTRLDTLVASLRPPSSCHRRGDRQFWVQQSNRAASSKQFRGAAR